MFDDAGVEIRFNRNMCLETSLTKVECLLILLISGDT